jgi:uncharacterized protein YecE (DUF72 family)
MSGTVRIGTSGWHYGHWKGPFYPETSAAREFLAFYAREFDTVEINNTFYQLPAAATLRNWRETVPDGFVFAVKAGRAITHFKKLKDAGESVARFMDRAGVLGDRLGPVVFQLPPRWHADPDRLRAFLDVLPEEGVYAFEFRDPTWFTEEIYQALSGRGAAFCIYDLAGRESPRVVTAGTVYVRLHGPGGAYEGQYGDAALADWSRAIGMWRDEGRDVYCYFDNDEAGYAPQDARRLKSLMA